MKKFSLQSLIEKIQLIALRFPFTLFFVLGLAFYFFLEINKKHIEIQPSSWAFFSLGIAMSLVVTLLLENYKNVYIKIGFNLLSIILLYVYTFTLPDKFLPVHNYQLVSLGFVFVLSAFFVSFLKKNVDVPFWEFCKTSILQLIISGIFAVVLMVGLSLAVLSLKQLFNVDVKDEVYGNLAVVCFAIFAPIYFLANIPGSTEKFQQEYSFPKFLKILGLYILLPILAIYSLILYVYLAQIIIKWQLPNGWVSTLVSILGLGGFLCMLILYPLRLEGENKVINLLSKYFPLLLLPLLVLMSVGIFRRLEDYGLTINRCYVLILNMWLYAISLYLFFSKSKHLKWIVISFSSVLFLSSVGPWSVFSITKQSLVKEIGQLLSQANLIENGKVIDNYNSRIKVDSLLSKKIYEDVKYICNNYGSNSIQLFFKDSIQNLNYSSINNRLGINESDNYRPLLSPNQKSKNSTKYFTATFSSNNQLISIANDYKYYIQLQRQNDIEQVYNGDDLIVKYLNNSFIVFKPADNKFKINIPLKSKLKEIAKLVEKDYKFSPKELTIDGANFKLVINKLTGFYYQKSDSITVTNIDANLFLK